MELFGLHMPDMLVTAVTVLYWLAVALLACAMRGWLWSKWKWYLLSVIGAAYVILLTGTELWGILAYIPLTLLSVYFLGKWKNSIFLKWNTSSWLF